MEKKPMTPMEQAVGRRLPGYPKHIDTVMARWAEDADTPSRMRLLPSEEWLRPAFRKAVKNGWLRHTGHAISFMGSRPDSYFASTDTGFGEAKAAKIRVDAINEARMKWARDSDRAMQEGRFPVKKETEA
jgi:hypothetical protein